MVLPVVVHLETTLAEKPVNPAVGNAVWVRKLDPVNVRVGTPLCVSNTPALISRG
jgi:hypothetical protein